MLETRIIPSESSGTPRRIGAGPRSWATAALLGWCAAAPLAAADRLEILFFEGDFGKMLSEMDPREREQWDPGFATSRFPVRFQDGRLSRDGRVTVGMSNSRIYPGESTGMRMMGLWTFDPMSRFSSAHDESDVNLVGLFVAGEFPTGSPGADFARTFASREGRDPFNGGAGWTQNLSGYNHPPYAHASREFDGTATGGATGTLMVLGYSTELGLRRDMMYANGYWAEGIVGRLASSSPAPLEPVGLSFSGVGLGGYRPSLWHRHLDTAGFAVGLRTFFAEEAANLTVELGHRQDLDQGRAAMGDISEFAVATRFQYRFTDRLHLRMDAYHAMLTDDWRDSRDTRTDGDSSALRVEVRVNF